MLVEQFTSPRNLNKGSAMKSLPSLQEIQNRFPAPVRWTPEQDRAYCVAGAFCRMIGRSYGFPGADVLQEIFLEEANKELDADEVYELCEDIVNSNDAENFDHAWKALDELLRLAR